MVSRRHTSPSRGTTRRAIADSIARSSNAEARTSPRFERKRCSSAPAVAAGFLPLLRFTASSPSPSDQISMSFPLLGSRGQPLTDHPLHDPPGLEHFVFTDLIDQGERRHGNGRGALPCEFGDGGAPVQG